MNKFTWAAPLAIAAVIAGSGVAAAAPALPTAIGSAGSVAAVSHLSAPAKITVTPNRAAAKAKATHAGSKVIEISLDRYRGELVWEVTVVSKTGRWEVSVSASTAKVVRDKTDDVRKRARDLGRATRAKVSYAKALTLAQAKHPGSRLESIELDREHSRLVWEIELVTASGAEYDLEINAKTGKILKNKLDD